MGFEKELKDDIAKKMLEGKFKGLRMSSKGDYIHSLPVILDMYYEIENCHIGDDYNILNDDEKKLGILQKDEIMYLLSVKNLDRGNALYTLMLRRKLIEEHGSIDKTLESIRKSKIDHDNEFDINELDFKEKLLDGTLFEKVNEEIDNQVNAIFNSNINCGGYALEVNQCIFGSEEDTEKAVLALLSQYSHIRLLGDTKLSEDEYIVIFRNGHHFIKVEDDGTIYEKDSAGEPRRFKNWSESLQNEEVVFAVDKNHDYMLDTGGSYLLSNISKNVLTFDQVVANARKSQSDSFEFLGRTYTFEMTEDGIYSVNSDSKCAVAQVLYDEGECAVVINDDRRNDIFHFSPRIPLKIVDGVLTNINDYKNTERTNNREEI